MIKIQNVVHGTSIVDVWFAEKKINDKGIINYRQAEYPVSDVYEEFITVENDLTRNEEEIVPDISKNGRYEIRRAERENVVTSLKCKGDIEEKEITAFVNFFIEFWKSKGVDYTDGEKLKKELMAYNDIGALAIGTALINEKVCVYHTYIVDVTKVRLLHSASLFRASEDIPKSILGMANRLLHKDEMIEFKKLGKAVYDWGGAGTAPEVAGITEFKKSFGGVQKIYYDFVLVNGIKAKLISGISKLKSKLKRR